MFLMLVCALKYVFLFIIIILTIAVYSPNYQLLRPWLILWITDVIVGTEFWLNDNIQKTVQWKSIPAWTSQFPTIKALMQQLNLSNLLQLTRVLKFACCLASCTGSFIGDCTVVAFYANSPHEFTQNLGFSLLLGAGTILKRNEKHENLR